MRVRSRVGGVVAVPRSAASCPTPCLHPLAGLLVGLPFARMPTLHGSTKLFGVAFRLPDFLTEVL
eukprot:7736612-Heterocapsa_arctica.AAC.1